jgi:hypothetical protein
VRVRPLPLGLRGLPVVIVALALTTAGTAGPTSMVGTASAAMSHHTVRPTITLSPHPGDSGALSAVDAASDHDVWAVGFSPSRQPDGTNIDRPLLEHWDGVSWSTARATGNVFGLLYGVSALGPGAAWAVGVSEGTAGGPTSHSLVYRYNGHTWIEQSSAEVRHAELLAVYARTRHDVWAVGSLYRRAERHQLILHWDGHQWARVPAPDPADENGSLQDVVVGRPGRAWVVGAESYRRSGTGWTDEAGMQPWRIAGAGGRLWGINDRGTILSEDASTGWTAVTTPSGWDMWTDVSAIGDTVWGAGFQNQNNGRAVVERLRGDHLTIAQSPQQPGETIEPTSIVATSPRTAWVVGYSTREYSETHTVILQVSWPTG